MRFSRLADSEGNVLLETIAFVTVAFGLILTAGLNLVQIQQDSLALERIARNSLRQYLVFGDQSLSSIVQANLSISSISDLDNLALSVTCSPDCLTYPHKIFLRLQIGQSSASAFGIIDE